LEEKYQEILKYTKKPTTLDVIKPSNIRKRNFGATLADALDKENAEKISDINDISVPIIKFQGGKSPVPWVDNHDSKDKERNPVENSDIKGERTRGALVRVIPKQSDNDWERIRVGVKRPIPDTTNPIASGSNIWQGSDNLERRGRIRIKSSFLGIYQKGQTTTRSPRPDDDVPQRPLKRDRIRNLRIRRPMTTNINSTENSSGTSSIEMVSTYKTTSGKSVPISDLAIEDTTEKIINLKGMVKEYKEIIRSTKGPTVKPTKITTIENHTSVKAPILSTTSPRSLLERTAVKSTPETQQVISTTLLTTTSKTTIRTTIRTTLTTTTSTISTSTTTSTSITMTTITSTSTSTTAKDVTTDKSSTVASTPLIIVTNSKTITSVLSKTVHSSVDQDHISNIDSAENVITTLSSGSDSSTKSFKQSIQSTASSTKTSLSVTESKESLGSDIKQSKAHLQKPSLFQLDITTRNPVDNPRPREELKKDLLEAIRRKISRNKAANSGPKFASNFPNKNQTEVSKNYSIRNSFRNKVSYSQTSNLVSSTKPPFFRPISFSPKKSEDRYGNQSLPKVKIFVNIPDKKKGSHVKIPNVSHIQDKLERLNAAITEGLKLERLREEEAKAIREDWQKKDDDYRDIKPKFQETMPTEKKSNLQESHDAITKHVGETNVRFSKKEIILPKSVTVSPTKKIPSTAPVSTTTTTKATSTATTTRKAKSTTLKTILLKRKTTPKQKSRITTPQTVKKREKISSTTMSSSKPSSILPRRKKNQKRISEHPSSHFRPENWTSNDFIPMPKSNLPPKEDVQLFVVTPKYGMYTPIADRKNKTSNNGSESESTGRTLGKESKVLEDITGTTVYVIGVIAIIPAAGLLAWFVRMVLRRKELNGSESSSETGLNRPITEDDSLQISGRGGFSLPGHCFETIAEAPENIPKAENADMLSSVWEFPRSRLRLQTVLGEGNFGKVWKAEADDICGYDGTILVAVKTVKENSAQREVEDLIQEMKIMQEIGPHPNVVTILGVCTEQEPYLLVMEYVMYGKLLTHLREQRMRQSSFFNFSKDGGDVGETLTSKDLNKFAYGVAKGMEFLVSKGIIHRDLAARNILVDHNKNTKISDFGLSRNLRDLGGEMYEQKTKGALPIRWMAPESLYFSVFTPKSDVWGFGILMWEIVTLGSTPYPGMGAREVMRRVRDGYRLERPAHCHPDLYLIIQKCWAGDMNKRPDFSELRKELAKLLEDQHGYIDLQNIPENKYYSMDKNPDEEEKL